MADGHDRVEVQPAEVGAEAAGPAQPVGIGDVRVEGGPHQVQAHAHGPGRGAAAAGSGGMAELVEAGGEHCDHQDQEHQARVGERLMRGRGQPLDHQHPPARGEESRGHGHHDQRVEQRGERCRELPGAVRVRHGVPEAHAQQRVRFPDLGLGTVRQPQESEGEKLGVDQRLHVVGTDQPAKPVARVLGDLVQAPAAVDSLEHQIQQAGQLDGLAVSAADQGGRLLVARTFRPAEQLDAGGPHRHRRLAGSHRRRRAGGSGARSGRESATRFGGRGGSSGASGRRDRRAVLPGRPSVHSAHLGATASGRTAGQPRPWHRRGCPG